MKTLYNIEVEKNNVEIYDVLKRRGMKLSSFKDSPKGDEYKVLSVIADSEDMLALRLCADITIIDDPEASGGLQTTAELWTERLKDRLGKIVS
jgi:hypothetical protein